MNTKESCGTELEGLKVFFGLTGSPIFQESEYLIEILCPKKNQIMGGTYFSQVPKNAPYDFSFKSFGL